MLRRRAFLAVAPVLAAGIYIVSAGHLALGAPAQNAEAFISTLASDALTTLSAKLSEADLEKRFQSLLEKNFDMPRIARFVLGRYWNSATDQEKQDFQKLFEAYVVRAYSVRFSEYSGETVKVTSSRPQSQDTVIVASQILQPDNAPPVKVDWIVRKNADDFRISDVSVDGVSMVLTQKQEFAAVIEHNGGGVTGLNRAIQDKLNGASTAQQ